MPSRVAVAVAPKIPPRISRRILRKIFILDSSASSSRGNHPKYLRRVLLKFVQQLFPQTQWILPELPSWFPPEISLGVIPRIFSRTPSGISTLGCSSNTSRDFFTAGCFSAFFSGFHQRFLPHSFRDSSRDYTLRNPTFSRYCRDSGIMGIWDYS